MTRLSLIDSGFLLTESHHSPKHVAALLVFRLPKGKGSAWLRAMLNELKQWPPCFPFNHKLKSRPGLLYELEPDPAIEIDYHVRHTVLPRPGNDRQLLDVVARMHANLLDRDRPLWEFHLVEGLSGRRFAFYFKVHHVLADGITMGRWLDNSAADSAVDLGTPPIWAHKKMQATGKNPASITCRWYSMASASGWRGQDGCWSRCIDRQNPAAAFSGRAIP